MTTPGENAARRLLDRNGHAGRIIRRLDPAGTTTAEADIVMMRRYSDEDKLTHEVSQETVWFNVRGKEMILEGFPVPPVSGDRILEDGVYFTVQNAEPLWSRGQVFGYKVRCTGG